MLDELSSGLQKQQKVGQVVWVSTLLGGGGSDKRVMRSSGAAHSVCTSANSKKICLKQGRKPGLRPEVGLWPPHMHCGTLTQTPPLHTNKVTSFSMSWLSLLIKIYQVTPSFPIFIKRKVIFWLHFPWRYRLIFKCHPLVTFLILQQHR